MSEQTVLTIAGIAIALAVPATFMIANWVRRNVEYGEARFDSEGKVLRDSGTKRADDDSTSDNAAR